MKLLINQPGRHGDILICLPIAKWYSREYEVDWLCPLEYHLTFRSIDYCHPVAESKDKYDKIIDMSFGINRGTDLHNWWISTRPLWQSFIIPKYKLANVPLPMRWRLTWKRDYAKEVCLYEDVVAKHGPEYSLVHEKTHDDGIDISVKNKVVFKPIEGYNVFDWYKVIRKAKEIHCIDSLLCNFVEVVTEFMSIPKFYYITPKVPNIWDRTLLINNWRFM